MNKKFPVNLVGLIFSTLNETNKLNNNILYQSN